eukprot:jgi/Mesvir1/23309/Mv21005-RA.1
MEDEPDLRRVSGILCEVMADPALTAALSTACREMRATLKPLVPLSLHRWLTFTAADVDQISASLLPLFDDIVRTVAEGDKDRWTKAWDGIKPARSTGWTRLSNKHLPLYRLPHFHGMFRYDRAIQGKVLDKISSLMKNDRFDKQTRNDVKQMFWKWIHVPVGHFPVVLDLLSRITDADSFRAFAPLVATMVISTLDTNDAWNPWFVPTVLVYAQVYLQWRSKTDVVSLTDHLFMELLYRPYRARWFWKNFETIREKKLDVPPPATIGAMSLVETIVHANLS